MSVYTFHKGPIDSMRQRCIDAQRDIYGDEHVLLTEWPDWFEVPECADIRYAKDLLFLYLMSEGHMVMDSDTIPKTKWIAPSPGLWLPHSLGRLDYYMGVANGIHAIKYVAKMTNYYEKHKKELPFKWQLYWFINNREGIENIPSDAFEHLFLTTNKGAVA